jgi:enediyne biosynthesis protein E4
VKGLLLLAALAAAGAAPPPRLAFRDVAKASGVTFTHHSAPEKKYIVESMSGGVALFDYDNDGRLDIYLVDALTVDTANDPKAARSALYRNLGGLRFEDVTDKAGVGHPGWGMGVCAADVDGDGWTDLYVTALGASHYYRNNHDGTFADLTTTSGLAVSGWAAGCGFADYDRDGDLDLFVSRYVKIDLAKLPEFGRGKTCEYRGVPVQCGPRGLPGEGDVLFRNDGQGRFADVSAAAGVADARGYFGLGLAWFDADGDGWPDLFVANDSTPNFLYLNKRDGTFKDAAFPLGVAVSEDGAEQGSMGVAVGDYDGNGRLGLFVTNFSEEYNALYRNEGDHFTDMSFRSGTAASSLPFVGWGTAFLDPDNDGRLDLVVVNGHVYPQLDRARLGASAPYRQRRLYYRNLGGGKFEEVAAEAGAVFTDPRVSRGLALGDLDDDGRQDLVVNDLDGQAQVLRNETEPAGHWLSVKLRGKPPNTSAIGAVVTARTGPTAQIRNVRSGTSYLSQDDMRAHFGLGPATQADAVEVLWPDGTRTRRDNVKADQTLLIEQGR